MSIIGDYYQDEIIPPLENKIKELEEKILEFRTKMIEKYEEVYGWGEFVDFYDNHFQIDK